MDELEFNLDDLDLDLDIDLESLGIGKVEPICVEIDAVVEKLDVSQRKTFNIDEQSF